MVVDSSAWIDLFAVGKFASRIGSEIRKSKKVIVPTIVLFEVYRKILKTSTESDALLAISSMSQYEVVDLNREIALLAGDVSLQHNLAMADSIVLATARTYNVELLTLDNDFSSVEKVKVLR